MTTYDRYLLFRFFHVFVILFIASIGLFAVVDGFTNLDAFQEKTQDQGTVALLLRMGKYYLYRSALIMDLAGPTIAVISVMVVLALMLKTGEIHPVLAAGIPTYRLALPLVTGVLAVCLALVGNQEWILPAIAPHLQGRHGDTASDVQSVQPMYDLQWHIFVSGKGLYPDDKRLHLPEFQLPAPTIAADFVTLRADDAFYYPARGDEPAGWLLRNVTPDPDRLELTELGRTIVIPQPLSDLEAGRDVFVVSAIAYDQLSRQASNHRLIATQDLFRRLHLPSGSLLSRRALLVQLHARLTRPIEILIGIFLVIPLIVRRERMSPVQQVGNIATCMAVLGIVFGAMITIQFLGQAGFFRPDQAVWGGLICGGSFAGWLSGSVRT